MIYKVTAKVLVTLNHQIGEVVSIQMLATDNSSHRVEMSLGQVEADKLKLGGFYTLDLNPAAIVSLANPNQ